MKQIETDHFYNYYQHLMTNNILKQIKHVRFITLLTNYKMAWKKVKMYKCEMPKLQFLASFCISLLIIPG